MILFLQGASHSGKTTFAKHLARLTGASVVSLDLLKMGLIKSGNSDFAGFCQLTKNLPNDNDLRYPIKRSTHSYKACGVL